MTAGLKVIRSKAFIVNLLPCSVSTSLVGSDRLVRQVQLAWDGADCRRRYGAGQVRDAGVCGGMKTGGSETPPTKSGRGRWRRRGVAAVVGCQGGMGAPGVVGWCWARLDAGMTEGMKTRGVGPGPTKRALRNPSLVARKTPLKARSG